MLSSRLLEMIRHFPENGVRFLLENPRNVQEAVALAHQPWNTWLDLARLQPAHTRFVQADFRHVEADLVFTAPLRQPRDLPGGEPAFAFLLLEHQSKPDRLLRVRTRGYEQQIYQWLLRVQEHQELPESERYLLPVFVLLLYTGETTWTGPATLRQLTLAQEHLPAESTLALPILNLPALSAHTLQTEGGPLGWVLWALQQRHAPGVEFGAVLRRVVEELDQMPAREEVRWREFLWYLHGLVYHAREQPERDQFLQIIMESVRNRKRRQQVRGDAMTIAEALKAEGKVEGQLDTLRAILLRQLQKRFGKVSKKEAAAVKRCTDTVQLNLWLDRVLDAESLDEMGLTG